MSNLLDDALDHPHSSIAAQGMGWRGRALDLLLRSVVKPRLRSVTPSPEELLKSTRLAEKLALRGEGASDDVVISQHLVSTIPVEQLQSKSNTETQSPFQILYNHGGAFIMCSPKTHRGITAPLAQETKARVVAPDYRLAPQHPFPAQLEDCMAVYQQLLESTAAQNIAIAGDSAGGNLTLALLHMIKAQDVPLPGCAVCLSPLTDLSGGSASIRDNINNDALLPGERMAELVKLYLNQAPRKDPTVSPLFGDFEGFPPLLFHVGDSEILLDDSLRCVIKARQQGVETHLRVWRDLPHVFHAFSNHLPVARQALSEVADFINTKLIQI